ncbi:MAG TPA: GGDEF domain-containing protein [Rhodospirillales bacterium]|nr:GGDEF domain-containing protein [Rhodospirillales bacterium]
MVQGCETSDTLSLGEQAMAAMRKHRISPTPENYLVWFTHFSGENPALSRMIRLLEENKDSFDGERCAELYQRFFVRDDAARVVHEASARVEELLSTLLEQLSAQGAESEAASKRIDALGDLLGKNGRSEVVAKIADALLNETRRMADNARELGKELRANSQQVAILRASLERVRREAETDPLTGLANRKTFECAMRRLATEAVETGKPLSLVIVDIDHFKRFNDTFGHRTGDVVLKLLATKLRNSVRERDIAARYGGEEFVLLLPATDLETAVERAEAVRKEVASHRLRARGSGKDLGVVTLSMGVAQYRPGEPLSEFFERADRALYLAKQQGRNRVIDERALPPEQPAGEAGPGHCAPQPAPA